MNAMMILPKQRTTVRRVGRHATERECAARQHEQPRRPHLTNELLDERERQRHARAAGVGEGSRRSWVRRPRPCEFEK